MPEPIITEQGVSIRETPGERRERIRAERLASAAKAKRRENVAAIIGGVLLTIFVLVPLVAVVSGGLWWLALYIWQHMPG